MERHHPNKFCGHRHNGSRKIGSFDFVGGSPF